MADNSSSSSSNNLERSSTYFPNSRSRNSFQSISSTNQGASNDSTLTPEENSTVRRFFTSDSFSSQKHNSDSVQPIKKLNILSTNDYSKTNEGSKPPQFAKYPNSPKLKLNDVDLFQSSRTNSYTNINTDDNRNYDSEAKSFELFRPRLKCLDKLSPEIINVENRESPLEFRFSEGESKRRRTLKSKVKHRSLTNNFSWSPPTQRKDEPYRQRVYSSNFPRPSSFTRSIKIKKWVQGKRSSKEKNTLDNEEGLTRETQVTKGCQDPTKFRVGLYPHEDAVKHVKEVPINKNRTRKVSRSTERRRHRIQKWPSIDTTSISSQSSIEKNESYFKDLYRNLPTSHYNTVHTQSDFKADRINALKDKLCAKGQPQIVLELLEKHLINDVLTAAHEGHTRVRMDVCLLWACIHGETELAEIFLKNGASPEARDAEGYSALHLAAESGSEDVIEILIREGARITGPSIWDNRGQFTPLMLAAKNGYSNIVSLLLQSGVDADAGLHVRSRTALHYAVQSGDTDCVQRLIDAGATINPLLLYSETPLHIAVEEGHSDIVELLLKAGADVRASRGQNKATCLHISAQENYFHITQQLLTAAANPNQEDSCGQTPLHIATKSQCYDTVQVLLNFKANPNARDYEGRTPLHTGIFKGSRNFECLKLLLESKASPNIPDNSGYTPLHVAALNDSPGCVKLLLKNDADMTHMTKGGVTALNIILRRTPEVITHIQESLNSAISFSEQDQHYEHDGQIQLDFRVLLAGSEGGPECKLLSCFMREGQKTFLKHPLCETFLFLKWIRVRSFFVFNLIFYIMLVMAFTHYVYMVFPATAEYHRQLSNATNHVLGLPFDKTNHSEQDISALHSMFKNQCLEISPNLPILRDILLYFLWLMLTGLSIKEGFQALDSPRSYLSSLDNVLVWPVILGSFIVTSSVEVKGTICPWEFQMVALILLFSWLELLLLIGRFPLFGLYVNMFGQVTKNFSKFLFTYICLINAFSLSFGILFHNQPPFQHRLVRMLKTLVMMTGEIEYNDWFFKTRIKDEILYRGTAHFVFALFLVFGTIILMNLLVGLAVSDIQGLQKSAGLDRLVRQTHLIAHFEGFMFSHWLKHFLPNKFVKVLHARILLLNSMYGNIFILNPKMFSNTNFPADLIDNIKRMARNRNHLSRRRDAFAEFRTWSSACPSSGSMDGDISRGIEALRCGLDVLVWKTEDQNEELAALNDKIDAMSSIIEEWKKYRRNKKLPRKSGHSDSGGSFISCQSDHNERKTYFSSSNSATNTL